MTSAEQARRLALDLPQTLQQDHHGRPSFRVAGKIFATLWDGRHMNVMLDQPGIQTAVQRDPASCTEFHWGKQVRAVHVDLDRIEPTDLAELLTDAWESKAPGRLTAATSEADPTPP